MQPSRSLVEDELERLAYVGASGRDVGIGEYHLQSRTWTIGRRPFRHHERISPGGTAIIRFDYRGRIARIDDASGERLTHVTLEPQLIGTFQGTSHKDRVPVQMADVPKHATHRCRVHCQPPGRTGQAGRQHSHPAACQESVPESATHDNP
jgi:hypothetical protein